MCRIFQSHTHCLPCRQLPHSLSLCVGGTKSGQHGELEEQVHSLASGAELANDGSGVTASMSTPFNPHLTRACCKYSRGEIFAVAKHLVLRCHETARRPPQPYLKWGQHDHVHRGPASDRWCFSLNLVVLGSPTSYRQVVKTPTSY